MSQLPFDSDEEMLAFLDASAREDYEIFAQKAFSIIEPGNTFEYNWHLGCFPYDAEIYTPDGPKKIGYLVESEYDGLVLSYNHESRQTEWRKVTNRMKRHGEELYRVEFSTGEIAYMTKEHPIYLDGDYTECKNARIGQKALRIMPSRVFLQSSMSPEVLQSQVHLGAAQKGASKVRQDGGNKRVQTLCQAISHSQNKTDGALQPILLCTDEENTQGEKTAVCQDSGNKILQILQKVIPNPQNKTSNILQSEMLWLRQKRPNQADVQRLWRKKSIRNWWNHLQAVLLQKKQESNDCSYLQAMFVGNYQNAGQAVLFRQTWVFLRLNMLWQVYDWAKQSGVHRWKEGKLLLQKHLSRSQKEGLGARWERLLRVHGQASRSSGMPPHRQEQSKQRTVEPSVAVQAVPQLAERIAGGNTAVGECYVRKVTKTTWIPKSVYNLEVDTNNNYFANGVLVHNCLSEHLMANFSGQLPWVIFNTPPRVLKSVWIAQLYPAWVMGKNPSHQFIGASYAHSLAERNVMKTRQAMTSDWYLRLFPETQISKDQNQKDYFTTTQAGQYKGTGIGGTITGYGCHCVSGDTLVTTSAGQRRIADLDAREGLQVMSYNHETGKAEWNNLLATKMTYRGDIVDVWIYGGISVRCTSDHPFYVVGKGYTPAEDLSRGDTVIIFPRADLETVCMATVNAVEEVSSKAQPVYDIQVENAHNFFANGILVHNSLIVDDPISPREAASDTVRKTAINEIRSTLFSRFNNRNDARFIMIMQRVHEDDPTGNLMRDSDGRFHLVKIPAEAKSQVVVELGERKWVMEPGELLTPRLGRKDLDELLLDLGPANYAGQYLQEPVPIGGGEFKPEWIQYYNPAKIRADKMNIVILVDPSGGDELRKKKKKTGDWSAYMVVGLGADKNYYLLDMVRDRLNPTERVDMLFVLHRKWSALGKKPPKVGYEKYGMMSDTHYIRQKQENESYRFPIIELGGSMMKEERIRRLIPDMHNGRWYFPDKLEYMDSEGRRFDLVKELVYSEMATFPRSRFDDCLDGLSRVLSEDLMLLWPEGSMGSKDYSRSSNTDWFESVGNDSWLDF